MRSAAAQVEDAIDLLKHLPANVWLLYFAGAVPMTLAVLWFARDMLSGYLADRCLLESLLCAAVFFFASFWKARFAYALARRLNDSADSSREDQNKAWECVRIQGCLQTLKLAMLPLAAVSLLPLPWVSALFRNVSVEANRPGATLGGALRQSALRASTDGRTMTAAFLLCALAGLVLFINIFVLSLLLPQLLKSFTGWESDWTRTSGAFANGNAFRVVLALTWLLLDPLLQAYSAVRLFHYEARTDGRDLLARLRRMAAAAMLLCAFVLGPGGADAMSSPLTADDITRGVESGKSRSEYAWLRAAKQNGDEGWFGARLIHDVRQVAGHINGWVKKLGRWIDGLFAPRDPQAKPSKPAAKTAPVGLQWILYALGGSLAVATVVLLVRTRRSEITAAAGSGSEAPAAPIDVTADVLGSERDEAEWLRAAREHAARSEWRLALRAMYLSNLAHLGSQHLIAIQKSKSNGMYERELRLRCRVVTVQEAFVRANRTYERVWYGLHEATPEIHHGFELDVQAVRGHA